MPMAVNNRIRTLSQCVNLVISTCLILPGRVPDARRGDVGQIQNSADGGCDVEGVAMMLPFLGKLSLWTGPSAKEKGVCG
jgi:hypothetical protein